MTIYDVRRDFRREGLNLKDRLVGLSHSERNQQQVVNLRAEFAELDAQALAEALADAYLMEAENAGDEERVDLLQRLAMKAIARLAWLRSMAD